MNMNRRFYVFARVGLAACAVSLVLVGCGGKDNSANDDFAAAQTPPPRPTTNAFDEFYVEGKQGADSAAANQQQEAQTARSTRERAPAPRGGGRSASSFDFNPNGRYVVQVSSSPLQREATRLANRLKDMGYPAYTADVENPTPELYGTYYRVRIGGFNGVTEAREFGNSLESEGFDFWVDRKANDHVGIEGAEFGFATPPQYQSPGASTPAQTQDTWSSGADAYHTPPPAEEPPPPPPPTYHEPTYQEPSYQEPAYHQPTYEQPAYQEPTYQETIPHSSTVSDEELESLFAAPPHDSPPPQDMGGWDTGDW